MAIQKFIRGNIYRHSNPNASLDIVVLAVRHANSLRTKMKIHYHHRINGKSQYTGKGVDQYSDSISIFKDQYEDWTAIGSMYHTPMIDPKYNKEKVMSEKPKVNIENWSLEYYEGEEFPTYLTGIVSNHPKINDGLLGGIKYDPQPVRTSGIETFSIEKNFVITKNTHYILGTSLAENITNNTEFIDLHR